MYINNTIEPNKTINSKGNKVSLNLASSIDLSKMKYKMRLLQSSITYCMPNIDSTNNLFKYTYNSIVHSFLLETGLYTLDSINKAISSETLKTCGNKYVYYFQANDATSHIDVYFTSVLSSIDCSGSTNVMNKLLGFENDLVIGSFSVSGDTAFYINLQSAIE